MIDYNSTTPNTTTVTTIAPAVVTHSSYPVPVIMTSAISCSLSVLSSFVIYGTYIGIPDIRNFTRRLVLCLTAADFLTCTGYLISVIRYTITNEDVDSVTCLFQSVITTYSSLVSFFLTVIIAFHLFAVVVYHYDQTNSTKTLAIYNVISWTIPAIIICIAVSKGVLGADRTRTAGTGPWCWVDSNVPGSRIWMLVTGKGWEILCYLLTSSLYVLLKFYLCRQNRGGLSEIHHTLRDEDKNFLYVWLILYIVRIWGTIRFFMYSFGCEAYHLQSLMKVLLYLQAAGDPSQAFVNAVLFCLLDKSVRRKICCRQQRSNVKDTKVEETERASLIPDGSQHSSYNSDYGTGNTASTSSYRSSRSTSSELEHMADRNQRN